MAASWKSMRVKFTAQNLDPHAGSSAPAIRQGALAPPCAARTTGNIVVHRVQLPPPRAAEPPLPHSALAPYWDERSVFHQLQLPPPTAPSAVARSHHASSLESLNGQVNAAKHVDILFNLLTQGGQIITRDDRVDARQQSLFGAVIAQGELAAAGEAQGGRGHRQAKCCDRAQCIAHRYQR